MNNPNFQTTNKKFSNIFYNLRLLTLLFTLGALFVSCGEDNNNVVDPNEVPNEFKAIEAPYLICANRNPSGVGFDFEYKGQKGGANNMADLTVSDFDADLVIRVLSAQKPNSTSLGGAPFIKLSDGVKAVNYSEVDPKCTGKTKFINLTKAEVEANSYTLKEDDPTFDLTNIPKGSTGKPEMSALKKEYAKLVIGDKWRTSANDTTPENEIIWIIKTKEGKLVKFIVTEFPAKNAATASGYVNIEWDFL